jgi:lipopolysaccharide export system permease protein
MTYDRYLLRNFLHTFGVCFISMFGLVAVIDLFENLDELLEINGGNGTFGLLNLIVTLNAYRSVLFLDKAGAALTIISVMTVLILLQRSGELHPLLAAGIPMYRILRPMIFAAIGVNGLLVFNQEVLVPQVAFREHEIRHRNDLSQSEVESLTDHSTRISIDGDTVRVADRIIDKPVFVLPTPSLVNEITVLEAPTAKFYPPKGNRPAGWLLADVSTNSIADLSRNLTDRGHDLVRHVPGTSNIFVVSAVTCDQLFKRSSSYTNLSTREILERIQCPAFGLVSVHRLVLYIHSRFMQPVLNVIAVLITIPLMVRRESPGLAADSSLCCFLLAVLFGVTQAFQSLGASYVITPDLAAWAPVVIGGALSAWLSGVIRT